MASGSLASTTKIYGTNVNKIILDEWTEWDCNQTQAGLSEPVYLEFENDPLAIVCAMLRTGKQYSEIAEVLHGYASINDTIKVASMIEAEDRERAIVVRKHFRNKILMRRLKNMNISKFMLAVDDLIESPRRINKDSVSPLLKLPDFYEEDKATESIFNAHASLPNKQQRGLHTTIEYVGTVKRRSSRSKLDIQYWRTPNNYLVRLQFPLNDMGLSAWQFLAQQGKVNIKSETGCVTKVIGYDYNVYALGAKYEIEQID